MSKPLSIGNITLLYDYLIYLNLMNRCKTEKDDFVLEFQLGMDSPQKYDGFNFKLSFDKREYNDLNSFKSSIGNLLNNYLKIIKENENKFFNLLNIYKKNDFDLDKLIQFGYDNIIQYLNSLYEITLKIDKYIGSRLGLKFLFNKYLNYYLIKSFNTNQFRINKIRNSNQHFQTKIVGNNIILYNITDKGVIDYVFCWELKKFLSHTIYSLIYLFNMFESIIGKLISEIKIGTNNCFVNFNINNLNLHGYGYGSSSRIVLK